MLQCSVLQCVVVQCVAVQCAVVCCNAACCSVFSAVCCSESLPAAAPSLSLSLSLSTEALCCSAVYRSVLQNVTVCCSESLWGGFD